MGLKQLFSQKLYSYIKLQPKEGGKIDETIFAQCSKICINRFWYVASYIRLGRGHQKQV